MIKKFFCPVNGWDCPCWKKDGTCEITDEGGDPITECDDASFFYDGKPGEGFFWEDEDGNRYDEQELLEKGYHFVNGEPISHEVFLQKVEEYKRELDHAPRYVNISGIGPS